MEVGRSSKVSNVIRKSKGAIKDNTKVSNTGMESEGRKFLIKKRDVKFLKLLASAKPNKLRLVRIQSEPIRRHPEVQISRESVNAAGKSKLSRGWAKNKRLNIISIKVTS
jgi:hypothetical protein